MDTYKSILQKDIPPLNHLSGWGKFELNNAYFLYSITTIFTTSGKDERMKPLGLWYSLKWYWIENLNIGMRYFEIDYKKNDEKIYDIGNDEYLYKVELIDDVYTDLNTKSLNKVLRLEKYKDFLKFYDIYKYVNIDNDLEQINWKKVYVHYGGIELSTIHLKKVFATMKWWWGWDVPSGCIWNKDLIKTFEIIL